MESLNYLLLQSWGDTVRVFPAVPERWKNVRFTDFSAEGAFLVSAERRDGKNRWVEVKSLKGGELKLRPNLDGKLRIEASGKAELSDGTLDANLGAGETIRVSVEE